MSKKWLIILFIVIAIYSLCRVYSEPIKGRVVDYDSGQPIEGVAVFAKWSVNCRGPAGSSDIAHIAREVVTDAEGRFTLPRISGLFIPIFYETQKEPLFYFYKPGYADEAYISRQSLLHHIRRDFGEDKLPLRMIKLKDMDEVYRYSVRFSPDSMENGMAGTYWPVYTKYHSEEENAARKWWDENYHKDTTPWQFDNKRILLLAGRRGEPNLLYVHYVDYIYGSEEKYQKSVDSGNTWIKPDNMEIQSMIQQETYNENIVHGKSVRMFKIGKKKYLNTLYTSDNNGMVWSSCEGTPMDDKVVTALCRDDEGNIYVGTSYGLYTSRDDGVSWTDEGFKYVTRPINAIVVDEVGNIYVGVRNGIYVKSNSNDKWEHFWQTIDTEVKSLVLGADDLLFAGTSDGLYRFSRRRR